MGRPPFTTLKDASLDALNAIMSRVADKLIYANLERKPPLTIQCIAVSIVMLQQALQKISTATTHGEALVTHQLRTFAALPAAHRGVPTFPRLVTTSIQPTLITAREARAYQRCQLESYGSWVAKQQ